MLGRMWQAGASAAAGEAERRGAGLSYSQRPWRTERPEPQLTPQMDRALSRVITGRALNDLDYVPHIQSGGKIRVKAVCMGSNTMMTT